MRLKDEQMVESSKNTRQSLPKMDRHYTLLSTMPEEIEYFSASSGFSDNKRQETDKSRMDEALAALEITPKIKQVPKGEKQSISYYVEPYEPPIPFPRR
ncbi:hypothetical protein Tco_1296673 [Tanacetum coccineum]